MGASDVLSSLKDKIIDAATYDLLHRNFDLLEENNTQLKEQAVFLKEQVATQRKRIEELEKDNSNLRVQLRQANRVEEFRLCKGIAFKRKANGKYSDEPYCPHCHRVMGVFEGFILSCSPCNYDLTLEGGMRLPQIAEWLDQNPE